MLCEHEDLAYTQVLKPDATTYNAIAEGDRLILGACRAASLAETASSRFSTLFTEAGSLTEPRAGSTSGFQCEYTKDTLSNKIKTNSLKNRIQYGKKKLTELKEEIDSQRFLPPKLVTK